MTPSVCGIVATLHPLAFYVRFFSLKNAESGAARNNCMIIPYYSLFFFVLRIFLSLIVGPINDNLNDIF